MTTRLNATYAGTNSILTLRSSLAQSGWGISQRDRVGLSFPLVAIPLRNLEHIQGTAE
jgi:hypothetical protein